MMTNYKADLDKIIETAHAQIDLAANVIRAAIDAEEKLAAFADNGVSEAPADAEGDIEAVEISPEEAAAEAPAEEVKAEEAPAEAAPAEEKKEEAAPEAKAEAAPAEETKAG